MAEKESAARAALQNVRDHLPVVAVSVVAAMLTRWVEWIVTPLVVAAAVYVFWRRGWRIVIENSRANKGGQNGR